MQGDEVFFQASASDGLDGDLSASIQWTSPLDGPLHTGASLLYEFAECRLASGKRVRDRQLGSHDHPDVYAIVNSPNNDAPFVFIEAPRTNTEIYINDSLTFAAIAFDNQQGEVSASIQWSSSLQGALSAGAPITVGNLQVGDHIIKALVTDSAGAQAGGADRGQK